MSFFSLLVFANGNSCEEDILYDLAQRRQLPADCQPGELRRGLSAVTQSTTAPEMVRALRLVRHAAACRLYIPSRFILTESERFGREECVAYWKNQVLCLLRFNERGAGSGALPAESPLGPPRGCPLVGETSFGSGDPAIFIKPEGIFGSPGDVIVPHGVSGTRGDVIPTH